ncbi:MATE family efflux transporter, partial [Bacteroides heparinolyticus]
MQTQYSYKQIWLIAYPILISLLMEQMIGMTDTAFLGRVGEVELGASAIAGIFYLVIFMLAFGFSIGTQILMARRNGEGQYKEIGNLFYQGIYFQVGLAAVIFLLSYCCSPLILKRIVASEQIYEAAADYLHWRVFGALFSFSAVIFRAFFLGTTQTRTLTLNSVVMVLSNVVFNYILIFGKLGLPALGIAGAAIGSSLAEVVSLLFFVLYTRSRIDCRKYGLDSIPRIDFGVLKRMLNISLWTMIQNFVSLSTWFLFFLYVEHLGERPLAVTNLVRNVSGILFM